MNDTKRETRWRHLLDRGATWGALAVSPPRHGVTRYRLVVFPPGISAEGRILLRAWRAWPVWGMTLFFVLEILLVPAVGANLALGISAVLFLGAGATLAVMTRTTRSAVRSLSAVRMAGTDGTPLNAGFAELTSLARDLERADRALADGEIASVAHEFLVWRVYDRMTCAAQTTA